MTRTTPEPPSTSPSFRALPADGGSTFYLRFHVDQACIHDGSWLESGFQPGTLHSQGRDLTNRPRGGLKVGRSRRAPGAPGSFILYHISVFSIKLTPFLSFRTH
ncbi:hypothetical protein AVEN_98808-1 [Araneus ventricosus]|uniref:Uncharacterized protein n=1 Tax=Araneus ventricosus TaxID=182803 RepID=A0A4Y2V1Q2_ARAVE|nr:hypothetical protein AVEN_98808-1 [Araneus ventricosus]